MANSKPISALVELLGLHENDFLAVVDTTVTPHETKKVRVDTFIDAILPNKWHAEARQPAQADGRLSDLWIDTRDGKVYEKQLTLPTDDPLDETKHIWRLVGSVRGPKGTDGVPGAPGLSGTFWLAEARGPNPAEGNDGDFFLDTKTGNIYQKAAGSWGTPLLNVHMTPPWEGPATKVHYATPDGASVSVQTILNAIGDTLTRLEEDVDVLKAAEWEGPAEKVSYDVASHEEVESVRSALDILFDQVFYVAPAVTSFTASIGTQYEIGQAVDGFTVTWAFNKPMESATLTDVGDVSGQNAHTFSDQNLTSNKTWTITCRDARNTPASRTVTIRFDHKRFYGTNADANLEDLFQLQHSEFSTGRSQNRTMSGGGEYIYFAYPASWGAASFKVNGLDNTAWTETTLEHTNASGHTATYRVYRTNTVQFGSGLNIQLS